jgi:hypothetical protein
MLKSTARRADSIYMSESTEDQAPHEHCHWCGSPLTAQPPKYAYHTNCTAKYQCGTEVLDGDPWQMVDVCQEIDQWRKRSLVVTDAFLAQTGIPDFYQQVHVSQHPSRYNPAAREHNFNCGPTATLMALRLFGAQLPGITDVPVNDGIRTLRKAVSGLGDERAFTEIEWFVPLLRLAGIDADPCDSETVPLNCVDAGGALLLRGEGRQDRTWYCDYPDEADMLRAGYHFVLVAGVAPESAVGADGERGGYIVCDPLSNVGPLVASEEEIRTFATVDDCLYGCVTLQPGRRKKVGA